MRLRAVLRPRTHATKLFKAKCGARLASPSQYLVERVQFRRTTFDEVARVFRNHPAHGAGELPDGTCSIRNVAGHMRVPLHAVEGVLLQARYGPTNGETSLTVRRSQLVERDVGALVASDGAFDDIRFTRLTRVKT